MPVVGEGPSVRAADAAAGLVMCHMFTICMTAACTDAVDVLLRLDIPIRSLKTRADQVG